MDYKMELKKARMNGILFKVQKLTNKSLLYFLKGKTTLDQSTRYDNLIRRVDVVITGQHAILKVRCPQVLP